MCLASLSYLWIHILWIYQRCRINTTIVLYQECTICDWNIFLLFLNLTSYFLVEAGISFFFLETYFFWSKLWFLSFFLKLTFFLVETVIYFFFLETYFFSWSKGCFLDFSLEIFLLLIPPSIGWDIHPGGMLSWNILRFWFLHKIGLVLLIQTFGEFGIQTLRKKNNSANIMIEISFDMCSEER